MSENKRIYYTGEPNSPFKSSTGKPVKYDEIKSIYNKSNLFEDVDFPASVESIGDVDEKVDEGAYTWLRPHELCSSAGFTKPNFVTLQDGDFSGGAKVFSERDIRQGGLGDCWYLSALTELTRRPDLVKFVIPEDNYNGFDDDVYCGAFHFRFYYLPDDKWIDIVIDDRLPAIKWGNKMKVVFTSITAVDFEDAKIAEFWPALIEKAYAKFIGSYAKIEGGYGSQALENFTGGFAEIIDMTKPLDDYDLECNSTASKYDVLKTRILDAIRNGDFITINTQSKEAAHKNDALDGYTQYNPYRDSEGHIKDKKIGFKFNETTNQIENDEENGGLGLITPPHAYAVLDAQEVPMKDRSGSSVCLLKVKNPHAHHEWSGPYSDTDDEHWSALEQDLRTKSVESGSTNIDEGVFWIHLHDVIKYFGKIEFCYFGLNDGTQLHSIHGIWPASIQSDDDEEVGHHRFTAYKFELKPATNATNVSRTSANVGDKCIVAFTLVLNGHHSLLNPHPLFLYYLYRVTEANTDQPIKKLLATAKSEFGPWNVARESSNWTFLNPATYIIIPKILSGIDPKTSKQRIPTELLGKDIPYTLRIFAENEMIIEEIPPV